MELKTYQEQAVGTLVSKTRELLAKGGPRICVLKAPTGSGKTIMVADFLRRLPEEMPESRFAFLWISSNALHEQSLAKLGDYLSDSRYQLDLLENVASESLAPNQVVFVNWESLTRQSREGDFTNVMMREGESGRSLPSIIEKTKAAGLEIFLVVDESHYRYWSVRSQELVQKVIGPRITLEVSATPSVTPSPEEIVKGEAALVLVSFEDAVTEGMVKEAVVINEQIGEWADLLGGADEAALAAALAKRQALADEYKKQGIAVNPLLLVQLPSESRDVSALEQRKVEKIEQLLAAEHGITTENGRLAVWLSGRGQNLEEIGDLESKVEVLIFKQAIALGWDCPRAQVLLMLRDIAVERFEIQTVGRIMRTPEARHYGSASLDRAYIYTNIDRVFVAEDEQSQGYFRVLRAVRTDSCAPVALPSAYLSRTHYGDLTLSFRRLFAEAANERFGIKTGDSPKAALALADKELALRPDELTYSVISDALLANIDEQAGREVLGSGSVEFEFSPDEIKRHYEIFAKLCSLPFAPARSHTKIQQAIYDWFDKTLGFESRSRLDIQRIVVCSERNQRIFREVIERAKERFREVASSERAKRAARAAKEYEWSVPEYEYFDERHEVVLSAKAALRSAENPAATILRKDRSEQERKFEQLLDRSEAVVWWHKNGEKKDTEFGIAYADPVAGPRTFYPDFIVSFDDGSFGIYDTKSGQTAELAGPKAGALSAYTHLHKKKKLRGGIVSYRDSGWFISGDPYDPNPQNWKPFTL